MNVAGQRILKAFKAPHLMGAKIFKIQDIDWSYVNTLADRSPNGLSAYSCDVTMQFFDGTNDLRYPTKMRSFHERRREQIPEDVKKLNEQMEQMGVPQSNRGVMIYGSMSASDILYSLVGLRRLNIGEEYWGHGDFVFDILRGLRPHWDWQPVGVVLFPITSGRIKLYEHSLLTGDLPDRILKKLRSICRCLVVREMTKLYPSKEFGLEAAIFTPSYQKLANIAKSFCIYDFYGLR